MTTAIVFLALLLVCLLAPFLGADSRPHDDRDRRRWLPGPHGL